MKPVLATSTHLLRHGALAVAPLGSAAARTLCTSSAISSADFAPVLGLTRAAALRLFSTAAPAAVTSTVTVDESLEASQIVEAIDGNTAAVKGSYPFVDNIVLFPITPSSPMAELVDTMAVAGVQNLFQQVPSITQLESELGVAGALHGALVAGGLTTSFTSSQGLLLFIPVAYKLAAEQLPCVISVPARSLATSGANILGSHEDIMAVRSTGLSILHSSCGQEAHDLAVVAHLASHAASMPFIHSEDGFRSSHEVSKVKILSRETLAGLVDADAITSFKARANNPLKPKVHGTVQGPEFFTMSERQQMYWDAVPDAVQAMMDKVAAVSGRQYHLFDYYGHPDAEDVLVVMGSASGTIEEVVDARVAAGEKVGLVKVRLFRPFDCTRLLEAVPASAKRICVLDRCREPTAPGEPLYMDVCAAFKQAGDTRPVIGGRYGLGGFEVTPAMMSAVYDNMRLPEPKLRFTVGIEDDLLHSSLPVDPAYPPTVPAGTTECVFYGLGADGTVSANKSAIKLIGNHSSLFCQGYFNYDARKSGGKTVSHLRFGPSPIKSQYLIRRANYIGVHNVSHLGNEAIFNNLADGGTVLINAPWSADEVANALRPAQRRALAARHAKLFVVDAVKIAKAIGLGNRTNHVLNTIFFNLSRVLPVDQVVPLLKADIAKTFRLKGEKVIQMNYQAVDRAMEGVISVPVPEDWASALDAPSAAQLRLQRALAEEVDPTVRAWMENMAIPYLQGKATTLPTSAFPQAGCMPTGTSKYEKRGVATDIPVWDAKKCVQCALCAVSCPHSVIRPFLLTEEEAVAAPSSLQHPKAKGKKLKGLSFAIQASPYDCIGCGMSDSLTPLHPISFTSLPSSHSPARCLRRTLPRRCADDDRRRRLPRH
jgi:pyruvate-ferredoxin/flavodoxin oxidoreductase